MGRVLALVAATVGVLSCASNKAADDEPTRIMGKFTKLEQLPASVRAAIPAQLAREFPNEPTLHSIEAYDGNLTATFHSQEPPGIYCYRKDGKVSGCELNFIIAKKYAKQLEPSCLIGDDVRPGFGNLLGWPGADAVLVQPPSVRVEAMGHGIAMHAVIDYVEIDRVSREPYLLSWKFSLLFQGGYYVACVESQAGYKQTYAKYVDELFRNVVVNKTAATMQLGYAVRQDWQNLGLNVTRVLPSTDPDNAKGSLEAEMELLVQAHDGQLLIEESANLNSRSAEGELLKQGSIHADNRGAHAVLSLKASGSEARFVTSFSESSEQESKIELVSPLRTLLGLRSELQKLKAGSATTAAFSRIEFDNGLAVPVPYVATRDAQGVITVTGSHRSELLTVDDTGRVTARTSGTRSWTLLAE